MIPVISSFGVVEFLSLGALLYIAQKFTDNILSHLFDKKVFNPIFKRIKRKIKIIKTRASPVEATFSVSYTPRENITIESAVERLNTAFEKAENASNGKITIEDKKWDLSDREGKVEFQYPEQKGTFKIDIDLTQDVNSLKDSPSSDFNKINVGTVGLEIKFDFPFHHLEDTLFNLGSLLNYVETGFEDQIQGSFSGGRFVISPVKNGLSIDDWVEEEKFDISLLLATEDSNRTEVEFFSDHAVVNSNQREIDAKTVNYMRELLLNYYL